MGSARKSVMFLKSERKVIPLQEKDFRRWRAVALNEQSNKQHLLWIGSSSPQVRQFYSSAFREILRPEEHQTISKIILQQWVGLADRGHWVTKIALPIPKPEKN